MSPDWRNDVLLAAFLRQPIIVAGHHYDAANGMEFLTELAQTVNRIEGVSWSDLGEILRTNYRWRIEGDVLAVKMYARRVRVAIPPGVRHLSVVRPWLEENRIEKLIIGINGGTKTLRSAGSMAQDVVPGATGSIEIASEVENFLDLSGVNPPFLNPWSLTRKMLMEVRDRLAPILPARKSTVLPRSAEGDASVFSNKSPVVQDSLT
jgi:hypothetical protein